MRINFNDGQEVVFGDLNKIPQAHESEIYERVIYELMQRTENAFFSTGFKVSYVSPTSVSVNAGSGFQTDNTQVAPESKKRLLFLATSMTVNLAAADPTNNRIDIIVAKANRANGATELRKYKSPSSVVSTESLVTTNDWASDVIKVDGTPSGSPVAPAIPAGYIKIAECLVTALTGMSGSGAVTDSRSLMPLGGGITIDTTGAVRITASATLPLLTAFMQLDTLAKFGLLNYNDFTDIVADPSAPGANIMRTYNKAGVLYTRTAAGIVPVALPNVGGLADWQGDSMHDTENNQRVREFTQGDTQKETLYVKVNQNYIPGRQMVMYLGHYSPSSSNQFKMQAVCTLIRKNTDAITTTTNQQTVNSGDITNTVANQYRELSFNLTDATGKINSVSLSVGDIVKVELTRIAPSGSEDTADIRMLPTTTEVKLG